MNTVNKGSAAERFVAKDLEAKGFVVASRRHIGGAGDLLAVHPDGLVYLVEVKKRKNPYQGFRISDREAMKATKLPPGGARWLANVKGSGPKQRIEYVAECEWP
jgi:Holliday junction resolvase-like predicted endonuclease